MSSEKLKIALISFHNAYNYGAAMQAYGLQETLQNMGVDAEYINYVNENRKHIYDIYYQIKKAIQEKNIIRAARFVAGAAFISTRGRKFNSFYERHLHITEKVYTTSAEASVLNGVYDKFIAGSDQIWNCNNNGGDGAYLLDFVKLPENKISYASSFGMSDIPEKYVSMYTNALNRIGRISVREAMGANIVENYTGKIPHVVLDPVFLPGIQTWEKLRQEGSVKNEDYVFFYTNRGSQIRDFWNLGYDRAKLKTHILSSYVGVRDFLDRNTSVRVAMSPQDFLNEIASAALVVTASFHCVAFSILFHKKFVVFLTGNCGKDERIINLLNICGLESRIVTRNTTPEEIDQEIDYNRVDEKLRPYLEYSKEYLRRAVFSKSDIEIHHVPDNASKYYCNDERCCGCMACVSVCPTSAVKIVTNEEGFLQPAKDADKCVDCLLCHEVCQVFNPINRFKTAQRYYAVKNEDKIREYSSSGGVFTALSDEILKRGGVICAASMTENYEVRHTFALTSSERDAMRKTVYVQSDISGTYRAVSDYLKRSIPVLFVGTPCQVAGIRRGLSKIDVSQLFTCDIVCHGVPSPGVFADFIEYLKSEYGKLDAFCFRDKELGWKHDYTVSAICEGHKVFNTLKLQSFSKMFSHNLINRLSCANCAYTNYNRVGDLSIGDFWGIERSHKAFSDRLGVSLVMVNTEKGQKLLDGCETIVKVEVEKKDTCQNSLLKQAEPSSDRMNAFAIYSKNGYSSLAKKYGEVNVKGKIKQLIRKANCI